MATGYTAISLTDGTNTTNLNDTTNYVLQGGGWSPRVARRLSSTIGNRCPYEDVTEEITISVIGSSPANAILKLTYITDLIESAKRYVNNENVAAVKLTVEPQSVSSGAWNALVLDGEVILPTNWADLAPTNNIENVTIRIVRRGIWTRTEYTSTTSSSTANQRLSAAVTLTDPGKQGYLSEILVTPNADEVNAGTYEYHPGYIVVTNGTDRVQLIVGALGTNDSANKPAASASNITQFSSNIVIDISTITSPVLQSSAKRVAILGTFKTSDQTIPVICAISSASGGVVESQTFTIPSYTAEDVQFCGVFNWSTNIRYVTFYVASGAPSISFDCGFLVDVSDPYTSIVKVQNSAKQSQREFKIVNGATDLTPYAQSKTSAGTYDGIPMQGDGWIPFTGTNCYLMRIARGKGNYWQPVTSTPTAITNTFRVKALEATLIPR